MYFSTVDSDNDNWEEYACALHWTGAWWYNHCAHSQLTGEYLYGDEAGFLEGVVWGAWKWNYSMWRVKMMIRPQDFTP